MRRNVRSVSWVWGAAAVLASGILAAGCSRPQSADEALDQQLRTMHVVREKVAPFTGRVRVDGLPPKIDNNHVMLVILYDPQKPPSSERVPLTARCDKEGNFEFTSYVKGDGAPVGSYVVLFGLMKRGGRAKPGYFPPDELHNLYNDPDTSPFKIELPASGLRDKEFDLETAGKPPVATPGPHAVTQITGR